MTIPQGLEAAELSRLQRAILFVATDKVEHSSDLLGQYQNHKEN
jgi:hypothetical protein